MRLADGVVSANEYQQEKLMKRITFAALTGALAISTVAMAIDVASAAPRGGAYRGGVNRVGVGRVGVNRVGVNRYYRPGLGLAAGAALGTAAAYYGGGGYYSGGGYNGNIGYGAYASAAYDASGDDTYTLNGNYMSEADAVAYCAQRFRSYDIQSRTFLSYSGERVSCPQ
jgi:hypothetical protein